MTTEERARITLIDSQTPDVFWAGEFPPNTTFTASTDIYCAELDFRQGPHLHGRFDHVYLVERDLGHFKQWPFVLDEAIRLLKRGAQTLLTLRIMNHELVEPQALATFLRLRHDTRFTPIESEQTTDGHLTLTLECVREAPTPHLNSFEFAVITNGERREQIAAFVSSVNNIIGIENIDASIAICGPESVTNGLPDTRVPIRVVPPPQKFSDRAWITGKKNKIVETSEFENLLIIHDRFSLPSDFLVSMYAYGADFDILNPAQIDFADQRVGDWVSAGLRQRTMSIALLDYNDYDPGVFVNGGAIIAKRHALQAVPWNEVLFWGQAEDIELSRACTALGFTPRLARDVRLRATDSRPGFREFFTPLPLLPERYASLAEPTDPALPMVGTAHFGRDVVFRGASRSALGALGVSISPDQWETDLCGLLPRSPRSEIAFDFAAPIREALRVGFVLSSAAQPSLRILANGVHHDATISQLDDASWRAESVIPLESVTYASAGPLMFARSLRLGFDADTPCLLSEVSIDRNAPTITYPVRLGDLAGTQPRFLGPGWSFVEPWGVWSEGPAAELYLSVPPECVDRDLELVLTASSPARPGNNATLVGVECNELPITSFSLRSDARTQRVAITVPRQLIAQMREVVLRLLIANPLSPHELGISPDTRKLGIGLHQITLGRSEKGRNRRTTRRSSRSRLNNQATSSPRGKQ